MLREHENRPYFGKVPRANKQLFYVLKLYHAEPTGSPEQADRFPGQRFDLVQSDVARYISHAILLRTTKPLLPNRWAC